MKYVLRVPRQDPFAAQYVSFHMFQSGGKTRAFNAGWVLGVFPRYCAQFDTRDLAQKCIDLWAKSNQPFPVDVTIEEYNDGV